MINVLTISAVLFGVPAFDLDVAQGAQDLRLQILTDRQVILVGEPLKITILITNDGDGDIRLPDFDFSAPGLWEKVHLSADGQTFLPMRSSFGTGREFHSHLLGPQQTEAYSFTLDDFREGPRASGVCYFKAVVDLREGYGVKHSQGVEERIPLAFSGSVESNVLEISVREPELRQDADAFLVLKACFESHPNDNVSEIPAFRSCIRKNANTLVQEYPSSGYSTHARAHLCIGKILDHPERDIQAAIQTIRESNLELLEDDVLLELYQFCTAYTTMSRADLADVVSRLRVIHAGRDAYYRAKALGIL